MSKKSILAPKTGFGLNRDKLFGLNRVGDLTQNSQEEGEEYSSGTVN